MPVFTFQARDSRGKAHRGDLDASDRRDALQQVRAKGWTPISVQEEAAPASPKSSSVRGMVRKATGGSGRSGDRLPLRTLLQFSMDLRDLLAAGLTLGNAVRKLSRQGGDPVRARILNEVHEDIVQGVSLSSALQKYPRAFPDFYVSLIRAGEASGQLQSALENTVRHYERSAEAREQVIGALVYPLLVGVFGVVVIIFCLVFVVPRFTQIFADLNQVLPLPTRLLMGLSDGVLRYGLLILGALVVAGIAFHRWKATPAGRLAWHKALLRLPLFSDLIRSAAYANFARTLSNLLVNGVPVLTSLDIVKKTANNAVLEQEIGSLKHKVTDGSSLSGPLAASGVFPVVFTDMLSVGEEAGQVPRALGQIANRYEEQLNRNIKRMTTVIEPVLMILIAAAVGFVAISMLLPLFQLTQGLQ